jgi:serine/threonine-protein kinase
MGSVEVALERTEAGEGKIVALKRMLPKAVLDKRQTEMFLREAKLASLLVHPNVVRATSFGEISGELFLVMEYIEGEPLSRVLAVAREREGRLALPLVAHILAEVCEGLHAAHELTDIDGRPLHVVHRDVCPHNVMVAYEGQIKLLDFGVAKIEAIDADGRTKTGEVKGKTAYMSPEQAMGDPVDRRSDLYSLGAMLFEAVAGRKMWGSGTDLEVLRRLALEEPPSLSDVEPKAPPALCQLQSCLVARDPTDRPSNALEVARSLRAFLASAGVRTDATVVRESMTRLFASEVDRSRAALQAAVEKVRSDGIDEIDATLAPQNVTTTSATRSSTRTRRQGWVPWVLGLAVLATVGGVRRWLREGTVGRSVGIPTSMSRVEEPPQAAAPIPLSSSLYPASDPRLRQSPEPPASAHAAAETAPSTPRAASDRQRARDGSTREGGSPRRSVASPFGGARPPSAPKSTAPLDVDPTPF